MSDEQSETRHFENWMSLDGYQKYKNSFFVGNAETFLGQLNTDVFSDLSDDEKKVGANLLAHFFFGVNMAYRKMEAKYESYSYTIDTEEKAEYGSVAYWRDKNTYIIRESWFKKIIKDVVFGRKTFKNFGGDLANIEGEILINDFFEIAGLEEAAHYMFFNEKGDKANINALKTEDEYLNYFTSEPERRALIWKKAYAKRYMPQYYDSLTDLAERVEKVRMQASEGAAKLN